MRIRNIVVFDDLESFIHFFIGFLSVILGIEFAVTICFVMYQYYERERWRYKRGDYVEFVSGLVIGGIIRCFGL